MHIVSLKNIYVLAHVIYNSLYPNYTARVIYNSLKNINEYMLREIVNHQQLLEFRSFQGQNNSAIAACYPNDTARVVSSRIL